MQTIRKYLVPPATEIEFNGTFEIEMPLNCKILSAQMVELPWDRTTPRPSPWYAIWAVVDDDLEHPLVRQLFLMRSTESPIFEGIAADFLHHIGTIQTATHRGEPLDIHFFWCGQRPKRTRTDRNI